jgi:hypothetical protein
MRQANNPLTAHVRIPLSLLLLGILCTSSGCIAVDSVKDYCRYNDNTNDFVMGWRNSVWARQAWHAQKELFVDHPQFHAFGEGFRDGYISVASGGNGCPPPVPPRRYWNWRYQTPEGQAQVAAWWEGFPYGARAADVDGAGLYQQIQVSHSIEVQYSPDFLEPMLPEPLPAVNQPPGPTPAPTLEFAPGPQRPPIGQPELIAPLPGAAVGGPRGRQH